MYCTHTSADCDKDSGPLAMWTSVIKGVLLAGRNWESSWYHADEKFSPAVWGLRCVLRISNSSTLENTEGSFEYLHPLWQTSWYLWVLPENNTFVSPSGIYPSTRRGPDLKRIPAGRLFNELICIGPISLCTAVIIVCIYALEIGTSHYTALPTQRIVGLFLSRRRSHFSDVLSLHIN